MPITFPLADGISGRGQGGRGKLSICRRGTRERGRFAGEPRSIAPAEQTGGHPLPAGILPDSMLFSAKTPRFLPENGVFCIFLQFFSFFLQKSFDKSKGCAILNLMRHESEAVLMKMRDRLTMSDLKKN